SVHASDRSAGGSGTCVSPSRVAFGRTHARTDRPRARCVRARRTGDGHPRTEPRADGELKVALVCDWYHPRVGGIERHLQDLAGELVTAGHDVVVITPTPGDERVHGI